MKKIIKGIVMKLVLWCIDDTTTQNEVFNSIRINALISELDKNGNIDKHSYENEIKRSVNIILGVRGGYIDRRGKVSQL